MPVNRAALRDIIELGLDPTKPQSKLTKTGHLAPPKNENVLAAEEKPEVEDPKLEETEQSSVLALDVSQPSVDEVLSVEQSPTLVLHTLSVLSGSVDSVKIEVDVAVDKVQQPDVSSQTDEKQKRKRSGFVKTKKEASS